MLGTRRQTKTTVQRHSLLQRQANVYSNQSSWFAWGLSFLGAYKTRKRNMKQFITKHTENKLSLIPTTIPLPTVLYEKKNNQWLTTELFWPSKVCIMRSIFTPPVSATGYFAANHFIPLAGHETRRYFWTILFQTVLQNALRHLYCNHHPCSM